MTTDWHERISQPEHTVRADKDIWIPMRDGVRIAADVFRPDGPGKFPALLALSPYGKDVQKVLDQQRPHSSRLGNGGQEAGDTGYFVSRGYVHVIADCRGSGNSEGTYDFQGPIEQRDGYDLIEWIAAQPWCDGNVGMLGMSYFGAVQLLVAAQQPPHLKAIAPYEGFTDRYRHAAHHGGILNEGFYHQWWEHLSVPPMTPLIRGYLGNNEVEHRKQELLASPEVKESPYLHVQLKYETKNPLMFDFLIEPHDTAYYRDRSANRMWDKINIPALIVSRWSGWPIHLPGAFEAWSGIKAPRKMIIRETTHLTGPMRPWRDHQDVILRWYDHWLKGNDTGMLDEPPITILVKGSNVVRDEHEWPLARTQWTKFYLQPGGGLAETLPASEERPSFANDPLLPANKTSPGLDFSTAPFEEPVEVIGPVALYLTAALDQPDATWIVTLRDVAPDGTSTIVTKGWLRASRRALDPERSTPAQPFHPHEVTEPVPVGEMIEYAIDIREACMAFGKGHRLVAQIRGQDSPAEDALWYHLCNPTKTNHTLQMGGSSPSYLLLPIIPPAS